MASESKNPKDMEDVKNFNRFKRNAIKATKKACGFFDLKEAEEIDWSAIKNTEISRVIEKIEAEKKPKVVSISPFVDGVNYSNEARSPLVEKVPGDGDSLSSTDLSPVSPIETKQSFDGGNKKPWFLDDYHRYDWLMEQTCFDKEDRNFIARFREESSLYRPMVFNDEEELDRKVTLWEERNGRLMPGGEA